MLCATKPSLAPFAPLLVLLFFVTAAPAASTSFRVSVSSRQSAASQTAAAAQADLPLELGKPVEREIHGGEIHVYRIDVQAGQFVHVALAKKGCEVAGLLLGPDGELIALATRPDDPFGTVPLSAIAAVSGIHLFRVFSSNRNAPAGKYEINLADLRPPQPQDSSRIAAERALLEAMTLHSQPSAESRQKAVTRYQEALALWRELGDRTEEATTLAMLGRVHNSLGEKQQALLAYQQALPLHRDAGNRSAEAAVLNNIALAYDDLGERQKALDYYGRALLLRREVGDRAGEATTLSNIGAVYNELGDKQKALDYLEQALPLRNSMGDVLGEATTLNNIGSVYSSLGEAPKALDSFLQALPLMRAVGDQSGEAITLSNIGRIYDTLGEKQKALDYYLQALPLLRSKGDRFGEATALLNIGGAYYALGELQKALNDFEQALALQRAIGDRPGEAASLSALGAVYQQLAQLDKALDYFRLALPLKRAVGDRAEEADTLNSMGAVFSRLGDTQKALEFYNEALPIRRAVGDRAGEAVTLNNLGQLYDSLGDKPKSLDYLNQALVLQRAVGDRSGEAVTLNNIGAAYDGLGQRQRALEQYNRALVLERSAQDPIREGTTLGLLMQHWQAEKKPEVAIFFGKQAIDCFQQVRRNIRSLEQSAQKSFAGSVEGAYRRLADLLVSEGRLFEAQQVLDLLKAEEFREFTRGDNSGGAAGTVPLTSAELAVDRRYREAGLGTAALWSEWNALNTKSGRTALEEQRLADLSKRLSAAEEEFQTFLSTQLYEQLGKNRQADATVRELEQKTSDLQAVLHELEPGTVALYTVVSPDRLIVILVLPDTRVARDYPIKPEELRGKVFALRRALLSPESDPLPFAQELYKIVLGPVETDLRAAGAKTLMWSLDDVLRYLPIAALYDGKHYAVENYRNEVFTLSSISKLKDAPHPESWKALAAGVSKSYGGFSSLPMVPAELHGIVHAAGDAPGGLLPGNMLLDDAFTKETFETFLRQGFPIVHVASHFSFQTSGDDFSFLLLGGTDQGGLHLTLSDIKTDVNIRFWNTELLTLSACESALSGERNGRELDGLGEIAQRKGAKAVIASLWSVNDRSTGALMRRFYEIWTSHPGMPKAEALRQAQIALLRQEVKPDADVALPGSAPPASFAHPYYWAPFILIGNWR